MSHTWVHNVFDRTSMKKLSGLDVISRHKGTPLEKNAISKPIKKTVNLMLCATSS
jgi:hypothetical protein